MDPRHFDGVVVAGSLSFGGHFLSLTPGSLSTETERMGLQTFTQRIVHQLVHIDSYKRDRHSLQRFV